MVFVFFTFFGFFFSFYVFLLCYRSKVDFAVDGEAFHASGVALWIAEVDAAVEGQTGHVFGFGVLGFFGSHKTVIGFPVDFEFSYEGVLQIQLSLSFLPLLAVNLHGGYDDAQLKVALVIDPDALTVLHIIRRLLIQLIADLNRTAHFFVCRSTHPEPHVQAGIFCVSDEFRLPLLAIVDVDRLDDVLDLNFTADDISTILLEHDERV